MSSDKRSFIPILANLLIVFGFIFVLIGFGPIIYEELKYSVKETRGVKYQLVKKDSPEAKEEPVSLFAALLHKESVSVAPINTDFSLVIEKIGLNVPVVANVSVNNKDAYMKSLKEGVAHASISSYPSDTRGNTYLFAHSSLDFWNLGKYAKAFNLLHRLENGDLIHVFYNDKDYVYEVVFKEVLPGWDTFPLERKVVSPVLTLQTCDPPGTTLNRLVITAKLIEVN